MLARSSLRAASLAALVTLSACGGDPLVQLRLHPCDADALPKSVRVEIQAYDSGGAPIGERVAASFSIPAASVFADGYATIGYARPEGAASADFTVGWFASAMAGSIADSAQVVILTGVAVPAAGEVLDLGAEACMPGMGTTSDGTSTSTGTSDSTSTSGTATSGSSSTATGTSAGSTTDATTDATTDTTTTTGSTSGSTTDATTATTGMVGMPCDPVVDVEPVCETAAPGEVGTLYKCEEQGMSGVWAVDTTSCGSICELPFYGFQKGVPIGCSGNGGGAAWGCLCKDDGAVVACTDVDQQCTVDFLQLCVDGELAKATCPEGCKDDPEPICGP